MTKVTTIQLSTRLARSCFLGGNTEGHHSLSHTDGDTAGLSQLLTADQWCAEQFGYVIEKLKNTPNPDGDGNSLMTRCVFG